MRPIVALLAVTTAAYAAASSKCALDTNVRDLILDFHNGKRKELAAGSVPNFKSAKNMYKLSWSCDLERYAKKVIQFCGSRVDVPGAYGANRMQYKVSRNFPAKQLIEKALSEWWKPVGQNRLDEYNRFPNHTRLYGVANIINSETTKVGCSYHACPVKGEDKDIVNVLCLYDDVADITGRYLYDTGSPCTKSEECTTYRKSTCEAATGLCVRPEEKPDDGKNTMCKKEKLIGTGMTDKTRMTLLDLHNDFRSLVASGKAEDKSVKNGFAPEAANMRKLEYDCKLEKMAAEYAQGCVFEHSTDQQRTLSLELGPAGENLYRVSIPDADRVKVAEWATRGWFHELREVGHRNNENILTRELWNLSYVDPKLQIGHYTQLAWGDTDRIGCSIQHCYERKGKKRIQTLVVCNCMNIGNRVGSKVYEIGTPCSKCPGYVCENNLCAKKSRS